MGKTKKVNLAIKEKELRAAQRDPAIRELLTDAEAQERRLEREGKIHRDA